MASSREMRILGNSIAIDRAGLLLALGVLAATGVLMASRVNGAASAPRADVIGSVTTVPGMPAVVDPINVYSETGSTHLSPAFRGDLERV